MMKSVLRFKFNPNLLAVKFICTQISQYSGDNYFHLKQKRKLVHKLSTSINNGGVLATVTLYILTLSVQFSSNVKYMF